MCDFFLNYNIGYTPTPHALFLFPIYSDPLPRICAPPVFFLSLALSFSTMCSPSPFLLFFPSSFFSPIRYLHPSMFLLVSLSFLFLHLSLAPSELTGDSSCPNGYTTSRTASFPEASGTVCRGSFRELHQSPLILPFLPVFYFSFPFLSSHFSFFFAFSSSFFSYASSHFTVSIHPLPFFLFSSFFVSFHDLLHFTVIRHPLRFFPFFLLLFLSRNVSFQCVSPSSTSFLISVLPSVLVFASVYIARPFL